MCASISPVLMMVPWAPRTVAYVDHVDDDDGGSGGGGVERINIFVCEYELNAYFFLIILIMCVFILRMRCCVPIPCQ